MKICVICGLKTKKIRVNPQNPSNPRSQKIKIQFVIICGLTTKKSAQICQIRQICVPKKNQNPRKSILSVAKKNKFVKICVICGLTTIKIRQIRANPSNPRSHKIKIT